MFIKENQDLHPKYIVEDSLIKIDKYPMTFLEFCDIMEELGDVREFLGPVGMIYKISDEFKTYEDIIQYFHDKIHEMLNILHSRGILHRDFHGNNIVVNPETGDCKIIDFGRSYYFDEIDDEKIIELVEFMGVDDLIEHEYVI